ncbi:threonine aldolase family protein [Rhodoligotrophos defluvii]|uniref:threonine aldolase family protein n=1 Tax=Rhodoligotrophos defluvii TaxID=2561934 RepID=UPI0010C95D3F|nr:low specificity L-threonine aldolase [Rhodoligotrophos defluvii]
MNFTSDNIVGVSPAVLHALGEANGGTAVSYGHDEWTGRAEKRLCDVFEREVKVFLVATGTAANALSLAALTPPYGAVLCHEESHINVDECGAPELFTGGAKLVPVREHGRDAGAGKIGARGLEATLASFGGAPHNVKAAAVSITQATEYGTVYTLDEIAAIADLTRRNGLKLHMDGARFANALASLNASPAEMTWRSGIDVLSLGFTKNGALGVEAVVFFDPPLADDFMYLRKRTGHLWSKGRFLGAQVNAMLDDDLWLRNAAHANAMARRLAQGLASCPGVRFPVPVEANALFPILPSALDRRLREVGACFYQWSPGGLDPSDRPGPGEVLARMVTSFATTAEEVDALVNTARAASLAVEPGGAG